MPKIGKLAVSVTYQNEKINTLQLFLNCLLVQIFCVLVNFLIFKNYLCELPIGNKFQLEKHSINWYHRGLETISSYHDMGFETSFISVQSTKYLY